MTQQNNEQNQEQTAPEKTVPLCANNEMFKQLFDNASDAIFLADPEAGVIIDCNKQAEILLESTKEQIIGLHQSKLHPPEKAGQYIKIFKEHIQQHGKMNEEAEIITKTGKILPVSINATLTTIEGKPIIQGVFRDLSTEKKTKEALGEAQKSNVELEGLNKIMIGREIKMTELKKEILELKKQLAEKNA